ncbi:MAG: hypothetical protein LM566_02450 [Pyrobaculum sp.]|jgi:hypothetical protein|nr:hypothetical protein [Pyrobaculum sp.]
MEPLRGKYKVFKTKKYTIYYLIEDVEVGGTPEKKIVKGGHEFFFFGDVVVIKPVKETSPPQEAP